MCSSDPDVPAEGNKAKCVGLACFVLSIFSMIGFATGGVLGGVGGLCACIAWSLMQCCYKGSEGAEKGKKIYFAVSLLMAIASLLVRASLVSPCP